MAWLSDEEYVYQQDIKEKKSAGRGAFHKKCGSKSKKCTLPSDHMTKKEREAMNGEVFHYGPRKWYTWEEFKAMPMEYQVKYVNSLITRYDIGLATISTVLFGLNKNTLNVHFRRADQLQYINTKTGGHGQTFKLHGEKMKADMEKDLWPNHDEEIQNGSFEEYDPEKHFHSDIEALEEVKQKLIDETPKIVPPEPSMTYGITDVQSFSIVMDHIDQDIINYIAKLFEGKKVSVAIDVKQQK